MKIAKMEAFDDDEDAAAAIEHRAWEIAAQYHGWRLDRVLAHDVPELSRNYLQQLVAQGAVHLNGVVVTRSACKVRVGDRIGIALRPTPQSQAFRPEAMSLTVVYEDDDLLIINKPAGLVVHPAPGHWGGTLLNGLLARDARAAALIRAGIVHRLDKDTSGLLVVARNEPAMQRLAACFAAHEIEREYVALAHGAWQGAAQRDIVAPIGRDPWRRVRMAVVDTDRHAGKDARTSVQLLHNGVAACLLRCRLHTGRTHQIRVHLAHAGHPLVADPLYGGAPAFGLTRQALHARRLALAHPITGRPLEFDAPLPTDLQRALQAAGFTMRVPD